LPKNIASKTPKASSKICKKKFIHGKKCERVRDL
jgi:hypothetical protein